MSRCLFDGLCNLRLLFLLRIKCKKILCYAKYYQPHKLNPNKINFFKDISHFLLRKINHLIIVKKLEARNEIALPVYSFISS